MSLIKQILQKYPQNRKQAGGGKRNMENLPFRLTIPFENFKCSRQLDEKKMCCLQETHTHKKKRNTPYECKRCDIGLCLVLRFTIHK
ncbi:unnamed protein product [Heterotrigona itama]|uniref:PiggyBac transposable element-derived protein 4 C-terminal zinc-ribbon domain-containing protein n=1 Tax=Heterotrigona itama TaxID=395501 RepID=A0A6V7HJF4_9HYME|nr:unnamed protein product [Heterotrigona itama]